MMKTEIYRFNIRLENIRKLGHPLFLISVFILIVNDFYLKNTFHNQLTGKLSDFAGLFAFPFLWSIVFPNQTKTIHFFTFFLFLFWKSELSQPVIDLINQVGLKTFRIIDYTDYVALISILCSYLLIDKSYNFSLKPILNRALFILSIFSFIATTQKRNEPTYHDGFRHIDIYNQSDTSLNVIINFKYSVSEVALDSNLNNEFNLLDTIKLEAGASERFITPVFQRDSTKFLADFSLIVADTLGRVKSEYNKNTFLKAVDKDYRGQLSTEHSNSWNLTIGQKRSKDFRLNTIYGRWQTETISKKQHAFEIREQYYYDIEPDSEVGKYVVKDSVITILYKKNNIKARILSLKDGKLVIKWDDKKTLVYKKVFD